MPYIVPRNRSLYTSTLGTTLHALPYRFVNFARDAGARFYGVRVSAGSMKRIVEEPWKVPEHYGEGESVIIPMLAGETVPYRLVDY